MAVNGAAYSYKELQDKFILCMRLKGIINTIYCMCLF